MTEQHRFRINTFVWKAVRCLVICHAHWYDEGKAKKSKAAFE
jgi:hypothetical protein